MEVVSNAVVAKQRNSWSSVSQKIVLRAWIQVRGAYRRWMKYSVCFASSRLWSPSVNISQARDKRCLPSRCSLLLCSPHLSKWVVPPPAVTFIAWGQQKGWGRECVCVCACVCVCEREREGGICVLGRGKGRGSWRSLGRNYHLSPLK